MATFNKVKLSESIQGRPIQIAATATAGTLIHTTSTSSSVTDEVWLYASNTTSNFVDLTIEYGASTDIIKISLEPNVGLFVVSPGLIAQGNGSVGLPIRAFASTANAVEIYGFVNRIQ